MDQEDVIGMEEKGGDPIGNPTCFKGEVKNRFSVREAITADFPAVLMGANAMWSESVYSHMDFDETKLIERFYEYTDSQDKRLFLLEQELFLEKTSLYMKRLVLFYLKPERRVGLVVC